MPRDPLDSVLQFTRATTEMTADRTQPIPGGWAFSTPSIPVAWGINHLRFAAPITYEDAVALAEKAQADLPFRRIAFEHGALSQEVEAGFAGVGWRAERDLLMVLAGEPDREVNTGAVFEADEQAHLELARRWTLEEAPDTEPQVLAMLSEFWRREARVRGDRLLAIPMNGGSGIAAKAKLRSDGSVAQIEDVYTLPEARGRGHARALITRAVQLAREEDHRLIFIVADEDGWPRHLYQRLGFEPVGHVVHLHRDLQRG